MIGRVFAAVAIITIATSTLLTTASGCFAQGVNSLNNNDGTLTLSSPTGNVTINSTYYYKCTGTDLSALNTAIASGIQSLTILGHCGVTAALNRLPTNFTLQGLNPLSDYISTSSATSGIISLASGDTIKNLGFAASTAQTSGDFIYASGVVNITLDNLVLSDFFTGIHLNGVGSPAGTCPQSIEPCSGVHARNLRLYGPTSGSPNDGILIGGASGSGQPWNTDVFFSDVFITAGVYLANGVEIQAAGDIHFDHLQTVYAGSSFGSRSGAGMLLNPNGSDALGNSVEWFQCAHCLFDSGNGSGFVVSAINGAGVFTAKLVDSWSSSNASGNGVQIYTDTGNGSAINEVDLVDDTIAGNDNGINVADNASAYNVNASNSCIAGNSNTGIYVGVGIDVFRINNNKIGACSAWGTGNGTGLYFGGSSCGSNGMVIGNDISGNTTNTFTNGCVPSVKANNINY